MLCCSVLAETALQPNKKMHPSNLNTFAVSSAMVYMFL